jgi:hypothetical protein
VWVQFCFFSFFSLRSVKRNILRGFEEFEALSMETHAGTFHGFAEHLLKTPEKYVNFLLEDLMSNPAYNGPRVNVRHPDNKLQDKLIFLYGRQKAILTLEDGRRLHVKSPVKLLSAPLFEYLDSLREHRNNEVHDQEFVYPMIQNLPFLVIQFGTCNWCEFFPSGTTLRFVGKNGAVDGTKSFPSMGGLSIHFDKLDDTKDIDLVPCEAHGADLVMRLITRNQAMEHHQDSDVAGALYAIVIFWGLKKFFFPINRGGYNKFTEATNIQNTELKSLYFRLRVSHTLKRIIEVPEK